MVLGAASAELARGNPDRAQRLTLELIERDATVPRAFTLRALAFFQSGDFDQAEKHLREAIRLDNDNREAIRSLKQARIEGGWGERGVFRVQWLRACSASG